MSAHVHERVTVGVLEIVDADGVTIAVLDGPNRKITFEDGLAKALASAQIEVGSSAGLATAVEVSGDITISNTGVTAIGAGKVTQAMDAANSRNGTIAANVANVNVIGGIPVIHRILASALTGNVDVTLTHKTRVIDAWCVHTAAAGAGDTIQIMNTGDVITDVMDLNVADETVVRAGTINDANHEIPAGGTLRVAGASGVDAIVYVLGIRVA